jgi:hypothetical protein
MSLNGTLISNNSFITIDTILDSSRTDYDINDRSTPMESDICDNRRDDTNISKETSDTGLPTVIYRFKFTEDFMEELYKFSKIHQYDERKDFKEAWKTWTEENQDIIDEETTRLTNLGYEGDIIDKMFKSARYYFRKKSTEKKEPRQRRQYISVNRELLDAMDNHIEENIFNVDYQPKTGFISFCKANEKILKESISKIFEQGVKDSDLIEDKIKKTYKNRYFMLTQIKNK